MRPSLSETRIAAVFERRRPSIHEEQLHVALERGRDGYVGAWCLELPGCWALVPPGHDPAELAALAVLEFTAWAHQRAAQKLVFEREQVVISESVASDADLRAGESHAFFPHDGLPATQDEFPLWAAPHDRAFDELRDVARSLPGDFQEHRFCPSRRTIREELLSAAATEHFLATRLSAQNRPHPPTPPPAADEIFRVLQQAHAGLQEVVCDAAPAARRSLPDDATGEVEIWSVRKVMRRSIWHLRLSTWEIRRAVGTLWLG